MDKVKAPALVRHGQHWRRHSGADCTFTAASSSDHQPFFSIETVGLRAVYQDTEPAQQDMQVAINEPTPMVG
jgi:hypothetical protein